MKKSQKIMALISAIGLVICIVLLVCFRVEGAKEVEVIHEHAKMLEELIQK